MNVRIGQDTMTVREAMIAACVWVGCVVGLISLLLLVVVFSAPICVALFFRGFYRGVTK